MGQTFFSNTLPDYSPLVQTIEHLQYKIHEWAIQEKSKAIITNVCLNDSSLSRCCKAHIDLSFLMDENYLCESINMFIYDLR